MSKPNFFSAGSPFLDHPLLTQERTSTEVDFVLAETMLTVDGRILDIGCGPGRHSIELARRGYQVVGIDPSLSMIKAAKERAAKVGVEPQFWQNAGEAFYSAEKFDSAICLFTTLGQINNEDKKTHSKTYHPLLKQVAKVLVPGGAFILEIPHKEWVINHLKKSERFGNEDRYTKIIRNYDDANSIVSETFTIVSPKETRKYLLRYHLFNPLEVQTLLENAGFKVDKTYCDFNHTPLTTTSPNMITVARLSG